MMGLLTGTLYPQRIRRSVGAMAPLEPAVIWRP